MKLFEKLGVLGGKHRVNGQTLTPLMRRELGTLIMERMYMEHETGEAGPSDRTIKLVFEDLILLGLLEKGPGLKDPQLHITDAGIAYSAVLVGFTPTQILAGGINSQVGGKYDGLDGGQ
jgi:hypothetical protein